MNRLAGLVLIAVVVNAATPFALAEEQASDDHIPVPGQFPPPNTAKYFAGELVILDGINRRGGLRNDGDGVDDRYDKAAPHRFSMLPYGSVYYHGAPAELRDIPLGTHLHGYFYLPPAGDDSVPPPQGHGAKYVPKYNHAILLEDDFSFYQRQGQAWKIASIDAEAGELHVVSTGEKVSDGLSGKQMFQIDRATRIWKGRESVELEDLAADQIVQVNVNWAPEWRNGQFHCSDIWIDQESRDVAAQRQRQVHIRYQHHRWLAGWVDHVEHQPSGGGVAAVTLFGGMDPSLYEEIKNKKSHGFAVAVGNETLRTYWQDHDHEHGKCVDLKVTKDPPLGSSGMQLHIQFGELQEGFRPGRIVRLRPHDWPNVKWPPEERLHWPPRQQ